MAGDGGDDCDMDGGSRNGVVTCSGGGGVSGTTTEVCVAMCLAMCVVWIQRRQSADGQRSYRSSAASRLVRFSPHVLLLMWLLKLPAAMSAVHTGHFLLRCGLLNSARVERVGVDMGGAAGMGCDIEAGERSDDRDDVGAVLVATRAALPVTGKLAGAAARRTEVGIGGAMATGARDAGFTSGFGTRLTMASSAPMRFAPPLPAKVVRMRGGGGGCGCDWRLGRIGIV
jgi:hypothetical protein